MQISLTPHSFFVFEGNRGKRPSLGILIKYKDPNSHPRSITHKHWAVDVLILKSHLPKLANEFLLILKNIYLDKYVVLDERNYNSMFSLVNYSVNKFNKNLIGLDWHGEFERELILVLVTLLSTNEKNSSKSA